MHAVNPSIQRVTGELRRAYSCENAVTLERLPELYSFG